MKNNIFYTKKMPKSSEFNVGHYLALFLIFTIMIIIYLINFYPDIKSLLLFLAIFFYTILGSRARLLKSIVIKKIEKTIIENKELTRKNPDFKKYLLTTSSYDSKNFYRKEKDIFLYGLILLLILYGIVSFSGLSELSKKYFLPFFYLSLWITYITFNRLKDIFSYFKSVKQECDALISKNDDIKLNNKMLNYQNDSFQVNKWRKINRNSLTCILIVAVISLLYLFYSPFYSLVILIMGEIFFLGVNTILLNKDVNTLLLFLSNYDEFIKERLEIKYHNAQNRGYSDLADELNRDIKDFFR